MRAIVEKLRRTSTKEECLQKAYDVLTAKYHGNRLKTYTRLWELFPQSLGTIWKRKGFLHCTNFNRLLRFLLLQSGHFSDEHIRTCWTLIWYLSPHQYLQVNVGSHRWIAVDVWAHAYGLRLGDYAHGFHAYT